MPHFTDTSLPSLEVGTWSHITPELLHPLPSRAGDSTLSSGSQPLSGHGLSILFTLLSSLGLYIRFRMFRIACCRGSLLMANPHIASPTSRWVLCALGAEDAFLGWGFGIDHPSRLFRRSYSINDLPLAVTLCMRLVQALILTAYTPSTATWHMHRLQVTLRQSSFNAGPMQLTSARF
jgi:hypothetical protein